MAKVTINCFMASRTFPYGTVAGALRVTLKNKAASAEEVFLEQEDPTFIFEDVAVGEYDVLACRLNAAGEVIGDVITQPLTITPSTTTINVPVSMGINVVP